jgi:Vitamin K-dependent gamma-carboxylase
MKFLKDFWAAWTKFFFDPISTLPLGAFRFLFGLNAFVMYSIRLKDWRFYFTNEGFVQAKDAATTLPEFFQSPLAWVPTNDSLTLTLHIVFVLTCFLLWIGLFGRIAAVVGMVLHVVFMQRNYGIVYGADIISAFLFFSLALSDNDRSFSVRAWLGRSRKPMGEINQMLTTIGVRLLQIQICIVYGYTGFEKLKGPSWWDGTAVWAVLGNRQLMMFDTSWLKEVPLVIVFATFSTLFFEIYFPALVWLKATRRWLLLFGVALHMGIALSVGLVFFSVAMMSTYFVYIPPESLEEAFRKLKLPARWLGPWQS